MTTAEKVAKILLEIKAITLNLQKPYRYTSGMLSPVYTDDRLLMSYPKERETIRDYYIQSINELNQSIDLIGATATAGIPHAAWIAQSMQLPMVYVRGQAKGHGKGNQIEGVVKKGQRAIIVEDHISTGKSSGETANALRDAGANVNNIFAITTYGLKIASDNFNIQKLQSTTLTNFYTVVQVAIKLQYIKEDEKQLVLDWARDPSGWAKKAGFDN